MRDLPEAESAGDGAGVLWNRGWATASGDPVDVETEPRPNQQGFFTLSKRKGLPHLFKLKIIRRLVRLPVIDGGGAGIQVRPRRCREVLELSVREHSAVAVAYLAGPETRSCRTRSGTSHQTTRFHRQHRLPGTMVLSLPSTVNEMVPSTKPPVCWVGAGTAAASASRLRRACAVGLRGSHHDLHFNTKGPDAFRILSPTDARLYLRTRC